MAQRGAQFFMPLAEVEAKRYLDSCSLKASSLPDCRAVIAVVQHQLSVQPKFCL